MRTSRIGGHRVKKREIKVPGKTFGLCSSPDFRVFRQIEDDFMLLFDTFSFHLKANILNLKALFHLVPTRSCQNSVISLVDRTEITKRHKSHIVSSVYSICPPQSVFFGVFSLCLGPLRSRTFRKAMRSKQNVDSE